MENNLQRELNTRIAEEYSKGRPINAIIMHPETYRELFKEIFGSYPAVNVKDLKIEGYSIYRSEDAKLGEFIL